MAVFLVTIIIGILNGADAVEFDRNQILTHVPSGTVGWVTLTLVASAFLPFRATDRRLATALAILVPVYVLVFYSRLLPERLHASGTLRGALTEDRWTATPAAPRIARGASSATTAAPRWRPCVRSAAS